MVEWHRIITSPYTGSMSMSGSFNVDGNATITGNVVINGTASVENLIVKQIGYSSGSNQLGDTASDTQTLYGSVIIPTGSLTVSGSSYFSGNVDVTGSGVLNGANILTDAITGSLVFTSSFNNFTSSYNTGSFTGSFTGLFTGSGNITSASFATTASYINPLNQTVLISGSLINTGSFSQSGSSTFNGGTYLFKAAGSGDAGIQINTLINGYTSINWASNNVGFGLIAGGGLAAKVSDSSGFNVGSTANLGAKLGVKGSGTTSATTAFLVQNANASSSFTVKDDGHSYIGSAGYNARLYFMQTNGNATSFIAATGNGGLVEFNSTSGAGIQFTDGYGKFNMFVGGQGSNGGAVAINKQTAADSSAVLEAVATNRGFLPPRTNLTSNISAPAQGLMTYLTSSTNEGLYLYNSGSTPGWQKVLTNTGSLDILGNVTIRGTASVDVLITNYESSSIIYSSGSTKFGDTLDDTHEFTGSLFVTGSTVSLQGGSFSGSGANLFNIPASGITGLNLSQIATGSVTASVSSGTGSFVITSGSSTFLFISSSGNIGIGTTTPANKLDISGSGRFTNGMVVTGSVNITGSAGAITVGRATSTVGLVHIQKPVNSTLANLYLATPYPSTTPTTILFQNNSFGGGTDGTGSINWSTDGTFFNISNRTTLGSGQTSIDLTPGSLIGLSRAGAGDLQLNFLQGGVASYVIRNVSGQKALAFITDGVTTTTAEAARFTANSNFLVGTTSDTARVVIKGSGTTSSTTALLVQNSNASASLAVLDNGYVGIGTSSPTTPLTINKLGSSNFFNFEPSATGTNPYLQVFNSGTQNALLYFGTTLQFRSNNTSSLLGIDCGNINASGTILLTGASDQKVHLFGSTNNFVQFSDAGTSFIGVIGTADATTYIQVRTGAATSMTTGTLSTVFFNSGNVGIGGLTADAGYKLNVSGSGNFTNNLTVTGSLTVSGALTGSLLGTSSYSNQSLSSSYALTASFALNTNTGSLLTTASVNLNTITFTKGDGSTFPITVNTGSGGGGGSTFPYTGSAIVTGSLIITGSTISTLGFTGSLFGTASISTTESKTITFNLGSIPTPITTGSKTNSIFYSPYSGSIKGFILSSNTGSTTTLNIWKRNNTLPTSSDTIITTNKPQLINNQFTSSYNVSGWTTSFSPSDVFLINVETNTSASNLSLQLITEIYK